MLINFKLLWSKFKILMHGKEKSVWRQKESKKKDLIFPLLIQGSQSHYSKEKARRKTQQRQQIFPPVMK